MTPDYIGIKALNGNSIAQEHQAETTLAKKGLSAVGCLRAPYWECLDYPG